MIETDSTGLWQSGSSGRPRTRAASGCAEKDPILSIHCTWLDAISGARMQWMASLWRRPEACRDSTNHFACIDLHTPEVSA